MKGGVSCVCECGWMGGIDGGWEGGGVKEKYVECVRRWKGKNQREKMEVGENDEAFCIGICIYLLGLITA